MDGDVQDPNVEQDDYAEDEEESFSKIAQFKVCIELKNDFRTVLNRIWNYFVLHKCFSR